MTVSWRAVYSGAVSRIGHDSDTNELVVNWSDGKTSAYAGVTAERVEELSRMPSVGSAIHRDIKPNHKHRYRT